MSEISIDVTDISAIPPLDIQSFLVLLQSIARFEKAKQTILPIPFYHIDDFAKKRWEELSYSKEEQDIICDVFEKMFSIKVHREADETFMTFTKRAFETWQKTAMTVTFFTSGSTGIPKPCTHLETHLRQELVGIIPHFKNIERALVTVPFHHLYGFTFGLLLPRALGVPFESEVPFPQSIATKIQKNDLLIAIPLLYSHLSQLPDLIGTGVSCISGTAPLESNVFQGLLDKGFFLLENFGSSELGVICSRVKPEIPFTLLPHFHVSENYSSIIRTLPDNEHLVCPMQDTIEWLDERTLKPKGRKDNAVKVGSINVFTGKVRDCLLKHPMINDCIVRLMRKEEGNRLKTFIVPKEAMHNVDEKELRKDIRTYMTAHLTTPEIPASITFGEKLPLGLIGKPSDW